MAITLKTFIVECPICRAKVAAGEAGRAERAGVDHDMNEPYGERIVVGKCPSCYSILVARSTQVAFENYDADHDAWSDYVRVFPKPPKAFSSYSIPRSVTESLVDGDRSLHGGANLAACVMFGRALEGLCRDLLQKNTDTTTSTKTSASTRTRPVMLGEGLKKLLDKKIIDQRLFDWSQQLQAFRNLAAHPGEENSIAKEDAEDLQSFVYAIVEYVYDLTERYEDFRNRAEARAKRKKT